MYLSRTPRGFSEPLDPSALAGCRAYCEGCVSADELFNIVDGLNYGGVICRTMSGWKHSSIKAIFAGAITLVKRCWIRSQYLPSSIGSGTTFIWFFLDYNKDARIVNQSARLCYLLSNFSFFYCRILLWFLYV